MKNRRDFIRLSGLAGVAALLPLSKLLAAPNSGGTCPIIPSETEGPFPYPGGELGNPLNIVDVRGGQPGLPLDLNFIVGDSVTCTPLPNVRIDIWHCNANGDYSGYNAFTGQFWLRGYQYTDANGMAHFTTIYPGWYPGRATHIHFEVFYNNVMVKTSQMAFDETVSDGVHALSDYHGSNPTTNMGDGIFNNSPSDLALETLATTGNTSTGYSGTYTIGISGITGIQGPENIFENYRIYPDRERGELIVTHPLAESGIYLKVLSMDGRIVSSGMIKPGTMTTRLDASKLNTGIYFLNLENKGFARSIKFIKD